MPIKSGLRTISVGVATLLFAMLGSAQAAPLTWTLSGVTFNDGASASGWFVYDAGVGPGLLSSFDIFTGGGSVLGPYEIATWQLRPGFTDGASYVTFLNPSAREVSLYFASPLTDAGGTISLTGGLEWGAIGAIGVSGAGYFERGIVAGSLTAEGVVTAPIPEPETYALLLAGLGLLGFLGRRRKQKEAAGE